MRDSRHIKERLEVRLDRVQLIWLTLGGVLAMGLMFAFGVNVGRRAERGVEISQAIASDDPLGAVDQANAYHKELTFYSSLKQPRSRDLGDDVAPPKAKKAPEPPKPATAPAPATEPPAPTADVAPALAAQEVRTPRPEVKDEIQRLLGRGPAKPGDYTVQVSSFQTMEEAKTHSAALSRKGFSPFVVSAEIPGKGTWYRVRLGSFQTEEQANAAKQLLAKSDIPAWVLKTTE